MWDLSCPDWEDRIVQGRSLIPDLPLNEAEADLALAIFDALPLPDGLDEMTLGQAAGQWFRDLVRVAFGSWDPATRTRAIRDILTMAPKGQSKTTYSAGLMITAMLMNKRHNVEALFVGPTQIISDRAYEQASAMIDKSADLGRRFSATPHNKTIFDLVTNSKLKVKTFDLKILTGSILIFALLDELHLLGRNQHTGKVLRQIRGGLDKTSEGLLLITTTQSDDIPAGAFKDELRMARQIRDGHYRGKPIRPMLPVLYEFPERIAKDKHLWQDPDNWPMVQPNLGRSVHMEDLIRGWNSEKEKGDRAIREWASQYLNIEMGVGLKTDGWPGAEHWGKRADKALSLEVILERSEVVVCAADGGGLDDLYGFNVLGRCRETQHWLSWSHAWCHRGVLERRKSIASQLLDFEKNGDLTIVDDELGDIADIVEIVDEVNRRGLLAAVAVDPAGLGELIDALAAVGITQDGKQVIGAPQGFAMMNAIKTAERKLANGTLWHADQPLMDWAVVNVKIEPLATAIRATKQNAGDAKIDPWCALMNSVTVMSTNPTPKAALEIAAMIA